MLRTLARSAKHTRILLVLALVMALALSARGAGEQTNLTFAWTTDIHGHLEPFTQTVEVYDLGGLARMATLIGAVRRQAPNLILLDAGDAFYNTDLANLFQGEPTVAAMNAMGYEAMVLGNHDFDFNQAILADRVKQAAFPILSANVATASGRLLPGVKPYIIKEVAGVKIGIIGLSDDRTPVTTHPLNVIGLDFQDEVAAGKKLVAELRGQVQVLVALTHLHLDDRAFLAAVPGIDIMICGGTHERFTEAEAINGALMVRGGEYGKALNRFDVAVKDGKVIMKSFRNYTVDGLIPEDAAVAALIKKYRDGLAQKMAAKVAETKVMLMGERAQVRTGETNLGNLIADAMRQYAGADVVLQNAGGIRASIPAGPITLNDIYKVLPFDNTITKQTLTGKQLLLALENGVRSYPAQDGRFPQISGFKFTFDAAKPAGSRVVSVTVNGKPLDEKAVYVLAVSNFMALGGDDYAVLKEARTVENYPVMLREALRDYLSRLGTVEPKVEGRITILNAK